MRSFWKHECNCLSHDSVLLGVISMLYLPTLAWDLIPYPYKRTQTSLVPSSDTVKSINWPITQSSHLFALWPPSTGCAMVGPQSKGAHGGEGRKKRKAKQNMIYHKLSLQIFPCFLRRKAIPAHYFPLMVAAVRDRTWPEVALSHLPGLKEDSPRIIHV